MHPPIDDREGTNSHGVHESGAPRAQPAAAEGKETERSRMFEVLRKERDFTSAVLDTAGALVVVLDLEGRIIRFNRACEETTGRSFEEVAGKPLWDLFLVPEEVEQVKAVFRQLCAGDFPNKHENFWVTKDGRRRLIAWSNTAIVSDRGSVEYIIATGLDITEQRQAEQSLKKAGNELELRVAERTAELAQANAALEELIAERGRVEEALRASNRDLAQFAYNASHDLQEPLRMLSSFLQALEQQYLEKLDENARTFIRLSLDSAQRMQRLINDLLSYARVGSREGHFEALDASAVVEQVIADLQAMIESNRAEVTHDQLPTITADLTLITQLFQNLVGNGIKFHGDAPPRVHVSATASGDEWVFSVRDNGIGIDPKHADRVFAIFERIDPSDRSPGTGIGLAICKRVVERHGGRIWFESQPGHGATFYFTIPRQQKNRP